MLKRKLNGSRSGVSVEEVCQYLRVGLAENRIPGLQRVVDEWCARQGISSANSLKRRVTSEPALHQSLVNAIMVSETYFFRHSAHFEFVSQHALPILRSLHRPVHLLSAGCSTGEEAYSLAMLLESEAPHVRRNILACDINAVNIRSAKVGQYSAWSMRNQSSWPLMTRYLEAIKPNKNAVIESIKREINFFCCNLTDDFPKLPIFTRQQFDLILCRNLMIYLTEREAAKLARRLISKLAPGGWIIPGPSDPIDTYSNELTAIETSDGFVFCKMSSASNKPIHRLKDKAGGKENELVTNSRQSVRRSARPARKTVKALLSSSLLPKNAPGSPVVRPLELEKQVNLLLQQEDEQEALKKIKQYLLSSPLCPDAYLLQALIYWQIGSYDEASASLNKAAYLSPDSPVPFFISGKILYKQGHSAQAKQQFLRAQQALARIDPTQKMSLAQVGTAEELTAALTAELAALDAEDHKWRGL